MNAQVVTGTLTDGTTIVLDEALAAKPGRVRLTVEPLERSEPRPALADFLQDVATRQAARGHVPRTREEIDRALAENRGTWGD
jgi:hypothetical protein